MVTAVANYTGSSTVSGSVGTTSLATRNSQTQIKALEQQLSTLQQKLLKTQCVQTQKSLAQQIQTVESQITTLQASSSGLTSNPATSAGATNNGTTATLGNVINTRA